MLSLAGPTPIHFTGTPRNDSMNSIYFLQFSGNASNVVVAAMDVFHPGSETYSTSTFARTSKSAVGVV